MTIQEALKNIDTVVSNARMTREQHAIMQQSLALVIERCKQADKLEKKEE